MRLGDRMYGDTTKQFILFLKNNGPQTIKQLKAQNFFGGVRSRVSKLIEQKLIERIEVANPLPTCGSHSVVTAYKVPEGADPYMPRGKKIGETYKERVRREGKERAVERAIKLLEQQGYHACKN